MRSVLLVVFWCWSACSIVIVARRAIHRRRPASRPAAAPTPTYQPVATQPTALVKQTAPPPVMPTTPPVTEPDVPSAVTSSVTQAVPPIAAALRGIAWPCDLGPLVSSGGVDFERRAVFFSSGYPAEVVGAAVADALEEIGMSITTLLDDVAVARRGDTAVRVTVRPIGAAVKGVADETYPTAPPNSVVVDFELT